MARNTAPDPDDPRKPDDPTDMTKTSWSYTLKKTLREFSSDQCTDLAAGLTYYTVLAVFPGILAIVSILVFVLFRDLGGSLFGSDERLHELGWA